MATPRVFLSWNTHPASHASPIRRRVGCDTKDNLSSAKVTNISGTSGMTCSGQIFTTLEPQVRSKDPKGKVKAGVEESIKMSPILDKEVLA